MDILPLSSLADYSLFVSELINQSQVHHSTVVVWSESPHTGIAEGEIYFRNGLRLRMREDIDFDASLIASYGYEIYRGDERLYWYDDFPHPQDSSLASTFPHHKHFPPDIKRHRIPTPGLSFSRPNLPGIIEEILAIKS
ncbi:MAG: DUF6516 family protein [Deltaproteobacteria bacterium]|nr:DUF6516 family protein [Deltaproteobacteria bacterium]